MPWRRTNPAKIRCNRILAEMSAVRKETSMQIMPILSENDMSLFELRTRYTRNYLTSAGKNCKDGTLFELSEKVVTIEHDGSYEKNSVLDCTSHFEEKPTEAQLKYYVKQYLKNTSLT